MSDPLPQSSPDIPSPVLECRTYFWGQDLPADFELPKIAEARHDAQQITAAAREVPGISADASALVDNTATPLLWSHWWFRRLPNLFKFSIYANIDDVPEDLFEHCLWALLIFVRILDEASPDDWPLERGGGHIKAATLHVTTILKLALYCLQPSIDQPSGAVQYLDLVLPVMELPLRTGPTLLDRDPTIYIALGEALVRTGDHRSCERAKTVLERVRASPGLGSGNAILIRLLLSRALRSLGETAAAQSEEAVMIKWFRRNPFSLPDAILRRHLLVSNDKPTSVLEGLGGIEWFRTRRHTDKNSARLGKSCGLCGGGEPLVKLSRCAKCQRTFYCSPKCQKTHWPVHKPICKDLEKDRLLTEELQHRGDIEAIRAADWAKWCDMVHDANIFGLVHALGLHRDLSRGRTHFFFMELTWNPTSKTVRDKFRVKSCGVFKVSEALDEAEKKRAQTHLAEADRRPAGSVPMLRYCSWADGIHLSIGCPGVTEGMIRNMDYNPNWRTTMNVNGDPPAMFVHKWRHVQDAEHIF